MDVKEFQITPSNAIGLESLRPPPSSSDVSVDDKQDAPINAPASVPPTLSDALIREAHTQADSGSTDVNDAKLRRRARWALFVMAFFMGDVQDGIGPFLGVYLQQHGWSPGLRGSVSTASGVATIIATAPIGALIDATK